MKQILLIFSVFSFYFNSFSQDCDELNISTNLESTYTLCNNFYNLNISISNPEQYENINWIFGDQFEIGANANFFINQPGLFSLIIQVEDINGCFASDEISFQVLEGPNFSNTTASLNTSLSNPNCIEVGTIFDLTTEISSLFTPTSITWLQTNQITATDYSFETEAGTNDVGNYPIQINFEDCDVTVNLQQNYTVQYETSFSNSYDGSVLCNGDKVTLTNTSQHPNWDTNFSWNIENAEIVNESSNSIEFYYLNDGIYNWKLNYNGSCPSSDEAIVTVDVADDNDQVTAQIETNDLEYCALPQSLDLNVLYDTTSSENLSFNWELNLDNTLINSSSADTFQYNIENSGAYNLALEVIDSNLSCSTKDTIQISIDNLNLDLDINSLYECKNYIFKPMDFALNNLNSSATYLWEIKASDGTLFDSSSDQNPSFNMNEVGVYDLAIQLSSNVTDCQNTILLEQIIEIYEPPTELELNLLESNSCFSETEQSIEKIIYAQFDDSSAVITSHNWSVYPSSGITIISETSDELKLEASQAGNYIANYTATIDGSDCDFKKQITFGIDALVDINMSSAICLGNMFTVTQVPNAAVGTNTSFLWSSPDSEIIIADSNIETTNIMTNVAGDYSLELTVTNNIGCTASDVVSFEAYEVSASLQTNQAGEVCKPAIIELKSLNNNYITNYTWNIYRTTYDGVESEITYLNNEPNFDLLLNEIATHDIELIINSQHGCKDTVLLEDHINTISPLPYFTLAEPIVSCDSVYQDIIDASIFIDSYSIDYGNGASQNYVLNDTNSTVYTFPFGGTSSSVDYQITLTAQHKFCTASYSDIITINQPGIPPAPIINYVSVSPQQNVSIEWASENLVDNFNTVDIYHETNLNSWNLIHSTNQILPNQILHITSANQINHYTSVQQNSCGIFSDSSTIHSTILLSSSSPTFQTVNLNWTNYVGWDSVLSYDIYRSEQGADYVLHDSVAGDILSYKDTNLCNTIYSYYVVAHHPSENFQSRSNKTTITPNFIDYSIPIDVNYTSVSLNDNIVTLWDAPILSDLTYYKIDRYDDYSNWLVDYGFSSTSAFIDTNVNVNASIYKYRVSYSDICGNAGPENGNTGKNILLKGSQNENEFYLTWNAYEEWNAGVGEYLILKINQGNTYQYINSVSGSEFSYLIDNYFTEIDSSYCYRVVAINAADSSIQSDSNVRCFIPPLKNYFPNAFSPNDDGINETYKFAGLFAKKIDIHIFNRWGQKVFSSDDVNFEWDGKIKDSGEPCPQGSYIMKYKITGYNNATVEDEMTINLLR